MFSIMLIDNQPAVLAGLANLVEGSGIARVIATETESDSAIEIALERRPDLILLDVSLGRVSGVDIARKLRQEWRDVRLLAVSAHSSSVYVRGMIDAGASGYMLKDNGPQEIADAITTVMQGGQWIGEGLSYDPA
jgi:DNA-binding NarL/FixJ family response regulator